MSFKILEPHQKFVEFQNSINLHYTNYSTLVRQLSVGINQCYLIKLGSKTSSHQNNCLNHGFSLRVELALGKMKKSAFRDALHSPGLLISSVI